MQVLAAADEVWTHTRARVAGLTGWPRRGAAVAAGLAAAAALAPVYAWPLLPAAFVVLVWLLDGAAQGPRRLRAAFWIGWLFGFGYFLAGLYWLSFSFFVQADEFAWMAPFAVLGMPAFLGLFTGMAGVLATAAWREGWARTIVLALAWSALEYARGHVLTGLPWNLTGQAFAGMAASAQSAAFVGAYGESLIALALVCLPAAGPRASLVALAAAAAIFAAGVLRLSAPGPGSYTDISVRVVQPNIPQREKIDPALWWDNIAKSLRLSEFAKPPAPGSTVYVVWPENAAPRIGDSHSGLQVIAEALPPQATLITGAVRLDASGATDRYYNSILVIPDENGARRATAHYDKHHLVPFGEYLPLKGVLHALGLSQLAPAEDGFTPGAGPQTLGDGHTEFAPLVCYEAIFPGAVYPKGDRPDWIVTVTNDAWFGDTSGPRQHLDQARLRSIETGLPMVRSANTGVSAIIGPRGETIARAKLYSTAVLDAALPKRVSPPIYARFGDLTYWTLYLLLVSVVLSDSLKHRIRMLRS